MKGNRYLCSVLVCLAAAFGPWLQNAWGQSYLFNEAGFATGTQPEALVSADFNGDGIPDIAVANHQPAGTVSILIGQANATFKPHVDYSVGSNPIALVAADFNGDGKLDLAVVNSGDDTVSVLLGNGDGTFGAATTMPAGTNPQSIAAGDLNGDGFVDLVVANYNAGTLSVFLGNGDGTFAAQATYSTGSNPQSVALGDFNGDGILDIVTADKSINMVSVLLGSGDGTFQPHLEYKTGVNPVQVVVGDFNQDGIPDLAVALAGQADLSILLGKGDGAFPTQETVATPKVCQALVAGDFTGNGILDLAVTNTSSNSVAVLLGTGTGTFPSFVSYATGLTGGNPNAIIASDFNGDGHLDLAIANPADNNVSLLLGNPDGTFVSATLASGVGLNPQSVAVGDFNGDGKPDLAVANENDGTVSVLINNGDGTFKPAVSYPTGTAPVSVAVADFDGKNGPDLAVANSTDGTIAILLNHGDGTFGAATPYTVGSNAEPFSVAAADLNGDTIPDLVVADQAIFSVSVLIGNGDGTFKAHVDYSTGSSSKPLAVAVGDFNGDGYPDVAAADFGTSYVSVLLNNGSASPGTLAPAVLYPTGLKPDSVASGDLNGDGLIDLVVGSTTSNTSAFSTLFGNGDGTFQTHLEHLTGVSLGGSAEGVALGDFDGDGALDVAVADQALNVLDVFLNEPVVAFSPAALNFPDQLVGTASSALAVTISNPGSVPLSLGTASVAGPFAETNGCASSLAEGANCSVSVTFTPTTAGLNSGSLTITNGAATSPQIIALSGTGIAPSVSLAPTSLTFGSQAIGATSAAQAVTLTNTGDGTLEISSITVSAQFGQTNNCGASLDPNASCTVNVTFTPTAPGTQSGTLTFTDNASDSPETVALTGTGSGPAVTLAPTSLSFGDQPQNSTSPPQTVTLTNTGNASLTITSISTSGPFAATNTCGSSVAAGGSCTISVTFTPTTVGAQNGTLTVADSASNSPQTAALTGNGTTGPFVSLMPSSLSFGTVAVGSSSSSQSVTLSNTGSGALTVTSIAVTGTNAGDFTETNTCGSPVDAGKTCTITVTFKPQATGARSATLSVTDNAPGSPQQAALAGTGSSAAGAALSPASLDFGDQTIGQASAAKTVTLTNTGNAALTITSISVTGGNNSYAETNTCGASVAAGKSCSILVVFTPSAAGTLTATLDVADNATGSPQTVALTGSGVGPSVGLAPASLTFNGQALTTKSAPQTVTLTNGGTAALTISSIAITGAGAAQFSQANTCGTSVATNASCTITVTFAPNAVGSQSAALTITDNAPNSPQSVPLTGAGEGFTMSSQSPSQTVPAGQSATYSVSITAAGGFSGAIALTCSQSIPAASCSLSPASITVTAPNTATAMLTVTTTARAAVPPPLHLPSGPGLWLWLAVAGVLASGVGLAARRRRLGGFALAAAMVLVLAAAGCGGSSTTPSATPTGTPAGTYTISVKGAATSASASTSVTLIVQ